MMYRRTFMRATGMLALTAPLHSALAADPSVAVIAHSGLKALDVSTLKRIYTGRIVDIDGVIPLPVSLPAGQSVRASFLAAVVQQSEADYLAYWTVRRYNGKGTPPLELPNSLAVLDYVQRTAGAIGYVHPSEVRGSVTLLLQR